MIRLHYSDVARAIAKAKTPSELESATRLANAYYATTATEPASERIRLLRIALEGELERG